MDTKQLLIAAPAARHQAYAPYSKFYVGAALLGTSGALYTGSNIENSSFSGTLCAERVAMLKAVSTGERSFKALAMVTSSNTWIYPCGICRQALSEFGLDVRVILGKSDPAYDEQAPAYSLRELCPLPFLEFERCEQGLPPFN